MKHLLELGTPGKRKRTASGTLQTLHHWRAMASIEEFEISIFELSDSGDRVLITQLVFLNCGWILAFCNFIKVPGSALTKD
jgi:hypothetical protein